MHRFPQRLDQPLGHAARVGGTANSRQQHHEFIATKAGNIAQPRAGPRARNRRIDAIAQRVAQPVRDQAQQLVPRRMTERVVDPLEVVKIQIQHREGAIIFLRRLQRAHQPVMRLLAIGQTGQRIEVCEPDDASLGAPLAAQGNGHLPHFMRMKGLLQVRELVFGGHQPADITGIRVGVGRADDDLDRRIQLPDLRGRPHPVRARRHAHVEEHDGERLVARQRLLHRSDRRLSLIAEHRLEGGTVRARFGA